MGNLFSETKFKRSMLQQFALVVPAEHGAVSRFQKWIELNHKDLFHVYGKAKVDDVRPKVIAKPMPNLGGEKLAHSRDDAAAKFCKSREKCQVIVLRQSIQRSVGHKAPEFHVDVHWNPFPHDQVFMKSLLLHQGEFHVLHDALRVQKCFHGVDASSHAQHLCSRLEQRNDSGIYRLVGRLPNVLAVQGAEAALGNGGIFGTPARRLDKHWAATKLGFNDVVNGSCQACHHGLRFGWECGLVLGMIRSLKNPCVLFGQWQKLGPKRGRSKQLDPVLNVGVKDNVLVARHVSFCCKTRHFGCTKVSQFLFGYLFRLGVRNRRESMTLVTAARGRKIVDAKHLTIWTLRSQTTTLVLFHNRFIEPASGGEDASVIARCRLLFVPVVAEALAQVRVEEAGAQRSWLCLRLWLLGLFV
eukprot:m.41964 g.41964  ORF g.41964 m.41964 type:complete len:414 (+) comp11506_c0_seq2:337-1578(+)